MISANHIHPPTEGAVCCDSELEEGNVLVTDAGTKAMLIVMKADFAVRRQSDRQRDFRLHVWGSVGVTNMAIRVVRWDDL